MSEPDDAAPDESAAETAAFDELREAAGAVIASLKHLIDATERVVADPEAFAGAVDGGRSIVQAFVEGFRAEAHPAEAAPDDANAESVDGDHES